MKVYELMTELAKMSSGAEVIFTSTLTVKELVTSEPLDFETYCHTKSIETVEEFDNETVFLG